jgi:hypothetical protein
MAYQYIRFFVREPDRQKFEGVIDIPKDKQYVQVHLKTRRIKTFGNGYWFSAASGIYVIHADEVLEILARGRV